MRYRRYRIIADILSSNKRLTSLRRKATTTVCYVSYPEAYLDLRLGVLSVGYSVFEQSMLKMCDVILSTQGHSAEIDQGLIISTLGIFQQLPGSHQDYWLLSPLGQIVTRLKQKPNDVVKCMAAYPYAVEAYGGKCPGVTLEVFLGVRKAIISVACRMTRGEVEQLIHEITLGVVEPRDDVAFLHCAVEASIITATPSRYHLSDTLLLECLELTEEGTTLQQSQYHRLALRG